MSSSRSKTAPVSGSDRSCSSLQPSANSDILALLEAIRICVVEDSSAKPVELVGAVEVAARALHHLVDHGLEMRRDQQCREIGERLVEARILGAQPAGLGLADDAVDDQMTDLVRDHVEIAARRRAAGGRG